MNNYQIIDLFPTPVLTTQLPNELSSIVPWFYEQEMLTDEIDAANYGERSKNSYILNEPECSNLSNYILNQAKELGRNLGYKYQEYKFIQSWTSYKYPGQHHAIHSHPNSLISGVFYFGETTHNTPAIVFHKTIGGLNSSFISPNEVDKKNQLKYAQKEFSIEFIPGLLILFPSYLLHSVPLNNTNKVRCSLAFNVVPKVGFGDELTLTELKF
jgi:uncharacterized protein (TIGR02466 family)